MRQLDLAVALAPQAGGNGRRSRLSISAVQLGRDHQAHLTSTSVGQRYDARSDMVFAQLPRELVLEQAITDRGYTTNFAVLLRIMVYCASSISLFCICPPYDS